MTFRHEEKLIQGTVFHFNSDGTRVSHHYLPAGTIVDRSTYVITLSSALDVDDFLKVTFDAESDVEHVIAAATTYCATTGYEVVGGGVDIWLGENMSALVEFCVPPGVSLPPWSSSGDRIPRQ